MNIRWRVRLSQSEREELTALLSAGKHAVRKVKRAQILLSPVAAAEIRCPVHRFAQPWDPAPWWPPLAGLVHPAPATRLRHARAWERPVQRHMIDSYLAALERL